MRTRPVYNAPALRVDDTLVIADLHIGVETDLMAKGFHLRSRTNEMFDSILEISDNCNHLVILGDVKDAVPNSSRQECREIPDFFKKLLEFFDDINVVKGNHDVNIEKFLPEKVTIKPASG